MPINFSIPTVATAHVTGWPELVDHIKALSQMLDPSVAGTVSNTPAGAKRFNNGIFEQWDGTSWVEVITGYAKTGASYNDPPWISGLAGSKISGGISGSAGSLTLGASGSIVTNAWAGGSGYHGYAYSGGNYRFGFSSSGGNVDVYADGNFYATDSAHLVLHAGNYTSYAAARVSGNRPGVTKLYRNDDDSAYNVQTTWSVDRSGYWSLRGYNGDSYHAPCFVAYAGYADSAGSAASATTATSASSATTASTANSLNTGNSYQVSSLGVGTAASGTAGEIRATNNVTSYYSDDRLKVRLGDIKDALQKVRALSGFYYQANDLAVSLGYEVKREVGVSAQQVQAVLPEVVAAAPISDEYLTVRYERLVPLLIEAVKELADIVERRG